MKLNMTHLHNSHIYIPDRETLFGVAGGVAFEVEIARDGVEQTEDGGDARMPETSQNEEDKEQRHHFKTVLVTSLNTVEDFGVFVVRLRCVHGRVEHLVLLPGHPHLGRHEEVQEAVEDNHQNHIPVILRKQFHNRRRTHLDGPLCKLA